MYSFSIWFIFNNLFISILLFSNIWTASGIFEKSGIYSKTYFSKYRIRYLVVSYRNKTNVVERNSLIINNSFSDLFIKNLVADAGYDVETISAPGGTRG